MIICVLERTSASLREQKGGKLLSIPLNVVRSLKDPRPRVGPWTLPGLTDTDRVQVYFFGGDEWKNGLSVSNKIQVIRSF
jgi:hypothetical protein